MSAVDKTILVSELKGLLEAELATLSASAASAHEEATHAEARPENKYDTRGLEASYLAGAQKRRAIELESMIDLLTMTAVQTFTESAAVGLTALVELEHEDVRSSCFIVPAGAGYPLNIAGHRLQAITPQSPLGMALHGKRVGDVVRIGTGNHEREYEIVKIS